MKKLLIFVLLASAVAFGQAALVPQFCNGGTMQNNFCSYSPAQLGANAIALPLNASTANTNIIDLRGVKELRLDSNCVITGGTWSATINLYEEDGTTLVWSPSNQTIFASANSNATLVYWIGSESNPLLQSSNGGSVGSNNFRLPMRAASFFWSQTGGTGGGTCTARLFLAY